MMTIASDKLKCSKQRTSFNFIILETTQIIEAPSEQSYDYAYTPCMIFRAMTHIGSRSIFDKNLLIGSNKRFFIE